MSHRWPIIFWLLVAANLCLDAVLFYWTASQGVMSVWYAAIGLSAMIHSQLSVVCIWSSLATSKGVPLLILPFAASVVAALITSSAMSRPPVFDEFFWEHVAYFGLQAALLVAALWLLRRTPFWRRRSGVATTWQYSMGHLLFVMTIIALLAVTLRQAPLVGEEGWMSVFYIVSSVVLAMASVVLWSLAWHWVLRLAGVLGVSIVLACSLMIAFTLGRTSDLESLIFMIFGAHYLIQGIALSVWLGASGLLPGAATGTADSEL
jgi:hypothetical protein